MLKLMRELIRVYVNYFAFMLLFGEFQFNVF